MFTNSIGVKNIVKFFVYFLFEKYYIQNIFTTNLRCKVVIGFNLNPPLKLFFYSPLIVSNNLLFRIFYENITKVSFSLLFFPFFLFD